MKSEIFNMLFEKLIGDKPIEVTISQELDVWNDADDDKQQETINYFFNEFIYGYGIFHELINRSNAMGNNHVLKISLVDGQILMEGKTYILGKWKENKQEEKLFKWAFDKMGNIILVE